MQNNKPEFQNLAVEVAELASPLVELLTEYGAMADVIYTPKPTQRGRASFHVKIRPEGPPGEALDGNGFYRMVLIEETKPTKKEEEFLVH